MANRKEKKKQGLLIIGIILLIIALLINKFTIIRLILTILASTLIMLNYKSENRKTNIMLLIIILVGTILVDSFVSSTFARIPIYSYNVTQLGNTRVYNALGYRIWQCDKDSTKNMKVDKFYTKGYSCDAKNIEQIDSNSFLNSVIENYDEYKNTYVKIRGKISKKNSRNSIEMQPYEQSGITLNGYVTFADNITLKILFYKNFEELDLYDIYDEITVVGIVKALEHKDEKFTVYLTESIMISENNFNDYEIIVNKQNTCDSLNTILYSGDDYNLYTYCLEDIFINYSENKYELSSALSSGKITIDSLFEHNEKELNENGDEIYKFANYSIIKCSPATSKDIIITSNLVDTSKIACSVPEEVTE